MGPLWGFFFLLGMFYREVEVGFRVDERPWLEIGTVGGKTLEEQDRCGRQEDSRYMRSKYGFNGLGRGCFIHLHDSSKVS